MDTEFLKRLLTDAYPKPSPFAHGPFKQHPVLMTMSLEGTDAGWRKEIRGEGPQRQRVQMVVCDAWEADRLFSQWCQLKQRQGLSIGGACSVRYDGPETIAQEKARYVR